MVSVILDAYAIRKVVEWYEKNHERLGIEVDALEITDASHGETWTIIEELVND